MAFCTYRYDNLLNRKFNADYPNQKWVTDISYIQTKEGVLYLSMIRDLYGRSIVSSFSFLQCVLIIKNCCRSKCTDKID